MVHPSFAQSPNHTVNEWEHVRTVELQMPLGRVGWWHSIKEKFLRGQASSLRSERVKRPAYESAPRCSRASAVSG